MKLNKDGRILFIRAMERLKAAKLDTGSVSFGGGTSLMLKYDHRISHDIDLFFRDPQCLAFISPRTNDSEEDAIRDYSEHTQFTRIRFTEGEIDYIVAPQLTNCLPNPQEVEGYMVLVDSPVEVVAKKVHFRADEFKSRDVFDLAIVYSDMRQEILANVTVFAPHLSALEERVTALKESGILELELESLSISEGGRRIRGSEWELFLTFIKDMRTTTKQISSEQ